MNRRLSVVCVGLFSDKSINLYNPIQELYFMRVPPFDMYGIYNL